MTGEWLAHCAACPVPEIANVSTRPGSSFTDTGMLHDDLDPGNEVDAGIEARACETDVPQSSGG